MNLLDKLPPTPFIVANYKELCKLLDEPAATGSSGRTGHLNHLKAYLDFESGRIIGGRKTRQLHVKAIKNPDYDHWISHKRKWAYDSTLLLGHYLTLSYQGSGPTPMSNDIQTLVTTTADLITLLGLGGRKVGKWRRGELDIEVAPDEQIDQFKVYYKFVYNILTHATSSLIASSHIKTTRWWALYDEGAAGSLWRLASNSELEVVDTIIHELFKELKVRSLADIFNANKEEVFYEQLNLRVNEKFSSIKKVWYVWWFRAISDAPYQLSDADTEELQLNLSDNTIRWAIGASIDPEIIDLAIARRIMG